MSKSHIYLLTVAVLLFTALTLAWVQNDKLPRTSEVVVTTMETSEEQNQTDLESSGESDDTDTDEPVAATIVNMVMLAENETGGRVTVAGATLTEDGYVVLFRQNSQGDVESIGSTPLLEAGTYADLSIQTDSPVAREQQVIAVLYADDGDSELELNGEDAFLTNIGGSIVLDIDVIDTDPADEPEELEAQAQELME